MIRNPQTPSTWLSTWINSGAAWVWLSAGAVSVCLVLLLGLLGLITVNGLGHFWPGLVLVADYQPPGQPVSVVAGEVIDSEMIPGQSQFTRHLVRQGNRDAGGADYVWVVDQWLNNRTYPEDILVFERRTWGNFYGFLESVEEDGVTVGSSPAVFNERLDRAMVIYQTIEQIEKYDMGAVNNALEQLRLAQRRLQLQGHQDPVLLADIEAQRDELNQQHQQLENQLVDLYQALNRDS